MPGTENLLPAAYQWYAPADFNYTEWLGTTTSAVVSNTYHPDNHRGVAPTASRVGFSVLNDIGYDILREFWADISRKFKLPFRGQATVEVPTPVPALTSR